MARSTRNKKTTEKLPEKLPSKETFTLAKPSNPKCSPGKLLQDQHSEIKMFLVTIGSAKGYGLYFKREGSPPFASWADKLLFDMIRSNDVIGWVSDINLYNVTFELHQNDAPVLNKRDWAVRVYVGFAGEELTSTILLEIAYVVQRNINATGELRDNQRVTVNPEDFLESIDASWYEYLGHEGARRLARRLLHDDTQQLGAIFNENPDDFHSFWKCGQITLPVARSVSLPASMSHEIADIDDDIRDY